MTSSKGKLGLVQGTALYIGAVLGPGALVLPGMAAQAAGAASIVAWLLLLALTVPVALCFSGLAARSPHAGGVAEFAARAFGPAARSPVGWWFYFATPIGVVAGAVIGGGYVAAALGFDEGAAPFIGAILLVAAFLANYCGVRVSGSTQLILGALLVALVAATVLTGLPHVQTRHFVPFAPHGWAGITAAIGLLFFAFTGWETVTHLSAEFVAPRRNLPIATVITLVTVGSLYVGLAVVTVGVLGDDAARTPVPLMALLDSTWGASARTITALVAVLLTFGGLNAYLAGATQLGVALGRDRALPRRLVGSPARSLTLLGVLSAAVLVVTVDGQDRLADLMRLTGVLLAAVTLAGSAAAVRLFPRGTGLWWCAILATVSTAAVLATFGVLLVVPLVLGVASLARKRVKVGSR